MTPPALTLYFFERVGDDGFEGPIVIAAPDEAEAWTVLAARAGRDVAALKDADWHVAQELSAIPARAAVVYPSHYRRAVVL